MLYAKIITRMNRCNIVLMLQLVYTIALLQVKNLLDELEFVIVPLVNPDGYVVSL